MPFFIEPMQLASELKVLMRTFVYGSIESNHYPKNQFFIFFYTFMQLFAPFYCQFIKVQIIV